MADIWIYFGFKADDKKQGICKQTSLQTLLSFYMLSYNCEQTRHIAMLLNLLNANLYLNTSAQSRLR